MHKSHQPFWHTFQNMLFWSLFDEFHEFESHRQMFYYPKLACKFSLLTLVVKKSCKYILRTVALQFKITVSIKKIGIGGPHTPIYVQDLCLYTDLML